MTDARSRNELYELLGELKCNEPVLRKGLFFDGTHAPQRRRAHASAPPHEAHHTPALAGDVRLSGRSPIEKQTLPISPDRPTPDRPTAPIVRCPDRPTPDRPTPDGPIAPPAHRTTTACCDPSTAVPAPVLSPASASPASLAAEGRAAVCCAP